MNRPYKSSVAFVHDNPATHGDARLTSTSSFRAKDHLTGLASRELLEREGTVLDGELSVILVDLDHFKAVNDTYGHNHGDHVLRVVGQRLRRAGAAAELLVRLSGDEFVIAMRSRERAACERLALQLHDAVTEPIEVGGATLFVQASVGVALADGQHSLWQLISRAGASIASVRSSGRLPNVMVFEPEAHGEILDTLALSLDLRAALARDELVHHYQPIVDMATREALGFEALVRWSHPTRGLITPLRFIPLAEEAGLMPQLGCWVLEQACLTARRWQMQRPNSPYVSVNLSVRQLEDPDFVPRFEEVLARTELPPRLLRVEVTESVLASDVDTLGPPLEELRRIGVGVLLDDFGTGYSSLGYVRELPLDGVKLDRIFTRDLTVSAGAWALARAVIGLVGQLGLEIIAEGLETAAHLAQLRSLGCHRGQGYYFARPEPPEALRFEQLGRATATAYAREADG
jgi:diguanylate cyclase (GGDEF)-like protein